jgi:hypothetical protein
VPQAGLEPTNSKSKRSRPTPQTARPLGPARLVSTLLTPEEEDNTNEVHRVSCRDHEL